MTKSHRITISLAPEAYSALSRVSHALDQSMSSVLSELAFEHSEMFHLMSDALEASKRLDQVAMETKRQGFMAAKQRAEAHYGAAMNAFKDATDSLIHPSSNSTES